MVSVGSSPRYIKGHWRINYPGQLVELPRDFVGQHDVVPVDIVKRGIVVLRGSPPLMMLLLVAVVLLLLTGGGGGGPRHGDDRTLEGVAPAKMRRERRKLSSGVAFRQTVSPHSCAREGKRERERERERPS